MLNFAYLEYDLTRPYIDEFISRIFETLLMAIWSAFLNVNIDLVKSSFEISTATKVTRRGLDLALSFALITLPLELLHESWPKLSPLNSLALPTTFLALLDVLWVVSTRTTAVRTDGLASVLDLHVSPRVEVFKGQFELDGHARPSLLAWLSPATAAEEVSKKVEWIMRRSVWLVDAFLSAPVILSPFVTITQGVVSR